MQPGGGFTIDAKLAVETAEKSVVVDGVECCRDVEADERRCVLVVCGGVDACLLYTSPSPRD